MKNKIQIRYKRASSWATSDDVKGGEKKTPTPEFRPESVNTAKRELPELTSMTQLGNAQVIREENSQRTVGMGCDS